MKNDVTEEVVVRQLLDGDGEAVDTVVAKVGAKVTKKIQDIPVYGRGGRLIRHRTKVLSFNDKPSLTKQDDKDKACIHNIIENHARGIPTGLRNAKPMSGVIPNVDSFFEAMELVSNATDAFQRLDSKTREFFENDTGKFVKFASNPDNKEKLIEMGLAELPPIQEPVSVVVENAPESPEEGETEPPT